MTNINVKFQREESVGTQTGSRIEHLLSVMTVREKVGQLQQLDASGDPLGDDFAQAVRDGLVGATINQTDVEICNRLQRIAMEETRLGIPLINARDVIHGFRTIFPIPLGQAATWNPALVRKAARVAAVEARRHGVHWTFAPMIDISRDPRWGRIAESFGEDPYLTAIFGQAMIEGFQTNDLSNAGAIAACAKHFVGYGASESGKDYNTTNIPNNELRNIYLPPFKAAVEGSVATFMTSFGDIDGLPATANAPLLKGVLREGWGFEGLVISDWNSVKELIDHGLCETPKEAAFEAVSAGVDMEMAGDAYANNLEGLIEDGRISMAQLDDMVAHVLALKEKLGLFDAPYTEPDAYPPVLTSDNLETAYEAAVQSVVLLKNEASALPLDLRATKSVAVIGPLADAPHEQIGTWVFDGQSADSQTPLAALRAMEGGPEINHAKGLTHSRSQDEALFEEAATAARNSDVALVFLGEESILSGEAHSRADISLPGVQSKLLARIKETGTKTIAIIMAGRPLVLSDDLVNMDALLYAWHPGTMAGPALRDLIFGIQSPSGKLPVTFPKSVGQIPIYYNHKNTGRPPAATDIVLIDDIEVGARQTSLGMSAYHLDKGVEPLFPFGFGLGYTDFKVTDSSVDTPAIRFGESLHPSCVLTNTGDREGIETVQLYIRDRAASLTRPVKELKAFRRISLAPGESCRVEFSLTTDDLAFSRRDKSFGAEAGQFDLWLATSSDSGERVSFELLPA